MKKILLIALLLGAYSSGYTQKTYSDSLQLYINDYIKDHEVVKGEDAKYIQFYPGDPTYRVTAKFEKAKSPQWFQMESSGTEKKMYRVYGTVSFMIHDTLIKLNLYQSQSLMQDPDYRDYLLLPFTDATSGKESYEAGRYLDFTLADIKNNTVIIDFNKAYNPYCAYEKDSYSCPMPPKENNITVSIPAGEKVYGKKTIQ